eukprot:399084-Pelagomonas_calceolata.AAC.6
MVGKATYSGCRYSGAEGKQAFPGKYELMRKGSPKDLVQEARGRAKQWVARNHASEAFLRRSLGALCLALMEALLWGTPPEAHRAWQS